MDFFSMTFRNIEFLWKKNYEITRKMKKYCLIKMVHILQIKIIFNKKIFYLIFV